MARLAVIVAAVIAIGLAAAGPAVRTTAHAVDDAYVLANARDPQHRLSAYTVDCPGVRCPTPWWTPPPYRRHFLRPVSSLALHAAVAAAGQRPLVLRAIVLALVLLNAALMLLVLVRLEVPRASALVAAALFAAHPANTELVATPSFLCVPVAATFVLAALLFWIRHGESRHLGDALACLAATALALLSYEGAVLLPLALAGFDRARGRRLTWLAWALPSLWAPYFLLRALVHTQDIARPLGVLLWRGLRLGLAESVGYLLKLVALVDWNDVSATWLHQSVGELGATLLALAAVTLLVAWARPRPLARAGLVLLAGFLAPPVLVRALVGVFNNPTLRQVYLPLAGAALIAAALLDGKRARAVGWCVVAFFVACSWRLGVTLQRPADGDFGGAVARALADTDAREPVAWIGLPPRYHVNFDWPDREQYLLVPPSREGQPVQLCAAGPRELVARAPGGFVGREAPRQRRHGAFPSVDLAAGIWRAPEVFTRGTEELPFATVRLDGEALRFTLARELGGVAFLAYDRGSVARVAVAPCQSLGSSK